MWIRWPYINRTGESSLHRITFRANSRTCFLNFFRTRAQYSTHSVIFYSQPDTSVLSLFYSNGNFRTSYHVEIISKYMYKSLRYVNLFCSYILNFSPSFFEHIYLLSSLTKYTFDLLWFLYKLHTNFIQIPYKLQIMQLKALIFFP